MDTDYRDNPLVRIPRQPRYWYYLHYLYGYRDTYGYRGSLGIGTTDTEIPVYLTYFFSIIFIQVGKLIRRQDTFSATFVLYPNLNIPIVKFPIVISAGRLHRSYFLEESCPRTFSMEPSCSKLQGNSCAP